MVKKLKITSVEKKIINELIDVIEFRNDENLWAVSYDNNVKKISDDRIKVIYGNLINRLNHYGCFTKLNRTNIVNEGNVITYYIRIDGKLEKTKKKIKENHCKFLENEKYIESLFGNKIEYFDIENNCIMEGIINDSHGRNNIIEIDGKYFEVNNVNIKNCDEWRERITERINEKVFYNEQWFNKKDFAKIKNHDLIEQLSCMREKMCGIGTRKVKLLLNEKIKEGDYIAELYRTALEIEDLNISAKKYHGEYREKYYSKKNDNILLLSELCNKYSDILLRCFL